MVIINHISINYNILQKKQQKLTHTYQQQVLRDVKWQTTLCSIVCSGRKSNTMSKSPYYSTFRIHISDIFSSWYVPVSLSRASRYILIWALNQAQFLSNWFECVKWAVPFVLQQGGQLATKVRCIRQSHEYEEQFRPVTSSVPQKTLTGTNGESDLLKAVNNITKTRTTSCVENVAYESEQFVANRQTEKTIGNLRYWANITCFEIDSCWSSLFGWRHALYVQASVHTARREHQANVFTYWNHFKSVQIYGGNWALCYRLDYGYVDIQMYVYLSHFLVRPFGDIYEPPRFSFQLCTTPEGVLSHKHVNCIAVEKSNK
jgi:hypothetical protein